eukprot:COSAG01_NODE_3828_length_5655_cov_3.721742_5_plen_82_part_00
MRRRCGPQASKHARQLQSLQGELIRAVGELEDERAGKAAAVLAQSEAAAALRAMRVAPRRSFAPAPAAAAASRSPAAARTC